MFGAFKKTRPFRSCDFVAYHGTYAARLASIAQHGLKLGKQGEIWLSRSPNAAAIHAARRAAEAGCSSEPVVVIKVRVKGTKDHCPVYRPLHAGPEAYMTTAPIPPSQVLGLTMAKPKAVAEGHARARRGKRFRKRAPMCPPPEPKG